MTKVEKKIDGLGSGERREFEIVEFLVCGTAYGIDVAKVREVIHMVPITKIPCTNVHMEGIFTLRGKLIPLVHLPRYLEKSELSDGNIIVSEINGSQVGFLVNEVLRIHKVSSNDVEASPTVSNSSMVESLIKMVDRIVLLLDFEKIVNEIQPNFKEKVV